MTDPELIEGILQRDRKAFQYLVNKYQKQVIKTAYYFIGNMEEAEDLSQDIFMGIIDSIKKFKGASALSTWIYRITVNKSLNVVKRNKRKDIFTRATGKEPAILTHTMEEKETREIMYRVIKSLPGRQYTAFTLHKFDDLPYKEIASIMEISLASVESLIHRAKMNLQKKLTPYELR